MTIRHRRQYMLTVDDQADRKAKRTNNCEACLGCQVRLQFHSPHMHTECREGHQYKQCSDCGSVYIATIPEDLSEHYNQSYYSFTDVQQDTVARSVIKRLLYSKLFRGIGGPARLLSRSADLAHLALARHRPSRDTAILDIGCGSGQLVFDLAELGFSNVLGVDPYLPHDIKYANGAQVLKKGYREVEGTWDIIMLNHVLEHFEDPVTTLCDLANLLHPQGLIVVRIPNVESYAFRKFRERWFGIQAPMHILLPSQRGMESIADRAAYNIIDFFGENVLELWLQNVTYALDLWHGHPYSVCSHMKNKKIIFPLPAFSRKDIRYWKHLNRHIKKYPALCDWVGYVLKPKRNF